MPSPVRKPLAALLVVAAGALGVVAAAAADTGLRPVDPISPNTERTLDIYYLLLAIAALVFLSVAVPLTYFVVRYRARGGDARREGPQVRGHTKLELTWTLVPIGLLAITAAFVAYKLPGITDIEAARGQRGAMEIRVEGRQYYWQYEYENGVIAIDELRVPVDTLVDVAITAPPGDVQHSFWVPPVGGKFDAIPGRTTHTEFRASKTGVYEGQCAEFCGLKHGAMLASVRVMPRAAFAGWLEEQATAQERGGSALGRATYRGACAKCHGFDGEGAIGPAIAGNGTLQNKEGLTTLLEEGQNLPSNPSFMPPVGRGWSERQIDALIAYVKSNETLAGGEGGGGGGGSG